MAGRDHSLRPRVPLLVRARLGSPLVGDAPMLDALLVLAVSRRLRFGRPPDRDSPAPPPGEVRIEIAHEILGGHWVYRASGPRIVDGGRAVVWLAVGNRGWLREMLKGVRALGDGRVNGVAAWEVEPLPGDDPAAADRSWYWPTAKGRLLMRPLPDGWWLPPDLIGYRRTRAAVCPPYWHPDRETDAVVPAQNG